MYTFGRERVAAPPPEEEWPATPRALAHHSADHPGTHEEEPWQDPFRGLGTDAEPTRDSRHRDSIREPSDERDQSDPRIGPISAPRECVCRILRWFHPDHPAKPSNILPFSGERRTYARSYHGREQPRAQPAAPRRGPRASEPRRRSSAATACWAAPSVSDSVRSGQRRSRRPRSRSTHRSLPATPQPRRDLLQLERSIPRSLRASADTPIDRPPRSRGQRVPSGVRRTAGRPALHFRAAPPSRLVFDCDRRHSCQSAQLRLCRRRTHYPSEATRRGDLAISVA